jgi:hypothetical protein
MRKNWILGVMLVLMAVMSTGCMAGPWVARETVDDWAANTYSENTLLGTVVYVFAWPIGTWGGSIIDMVVMNNMAFWGEDVWDGTGSTFDHKDAPNGKGNTGNTTTSF